MGPDLYSSPLEILSCIDLEFRRTSSGSLDESPGRILSLGERAFRGTSGSRNRRNIKRKMKGRDDRGKGIEILETRILVKAGIYRESEENLESVLASIVGIYRNGFENGYDAPCIVPRISSFRRSIRFDNGHKRGWKRLCLDPLIKIRDNEFSCSISVRSMRSIAKFRVARLQLQSGANSSGDSAGRFAINAFDRVDVRSRMTITYR